MSDTVPAVQAGSQRVRSSSLTQLDLTNGIPNGDSLLESGFSRPRSQSISCTDNRTALKQLCGISFNKEKEEKKTDATDTVVPKRGFATSLLDDVEKSQDLDLSRVKNVTLSFQGFNSAAEVLSACGGVLIDFDEVVHAVYVIGKDMHNFLQSHDMKVVFSRYVIMAQDWKNSPHTAIQEAVLPAEGVFGITIDFSVGVATLFFALLAFVEGVRGYSASLKEEVCLKNIIHKESKNLDPLRALNQKEKVDLNSVIIYIENKISNCQIALWHNKFGGRIGIASAVSGACIILKVFVAFAGQILNLVARGVLSASEIVMAQIPVVGSISSVLGAISSIVLAPIAAIASVTLGALFVKKSRRQLKELETRCAASFPWIRDSVLIQNGVSKKDCSNYSYYTFLNQKVAQRKSFFLWFSRACTGFLVGSVLYTILTVSFTIMSVILLAGVLPNPAILSIALMAITTLGFLAGGIMFLFSVQFLQGHVKQGRYDGYRSRQEMQLDRLLLSSLDGMPTSDGQRSTMGFDLRALFFEQIRNGENERRDLLKIIADEKGKWQKPVYYSTDCEVESKPFLIWVKKKINDLRYETKVGSSLVRRFRSVLVGCKVFVKELFVAKSFKTAYKRASHERMHATDRLSTSLILEWLSEQGSISAQIKFLKAIATEKKSLFQGLLSAKKMLMVGYLNQNDTENENISQTSYCDNSFQKTLEFFAMWTLIEEKISKLEKEWTTGNISDLKGIFKKLAEIKNAFVGAQQGHNKHCVAQPTKCKRNSHVEAGENGPIDVGDPQFIEKVNSKFAVFIRKGGGAQLIYKKLRSQLIETELDAAEVYGASNKA